MLYGAVEGGGTKFVCAVGDEAGNVLAERRIPTTTPADTLGAMVAFLQQASAEQGRDLDAIGVATFGPVVLDPAADDYGTITTTPKDGWAFTDVLGPLRAAFPQVPLRIENDVNGAALGEHRWGAAQGWATFVYFTVGTGIGGGVMAGGCLQHGLLHPEVGHILLPLHPDDPLPRGVCPYHSGCLEGLASGPALAARWGQPGESLPPAHKAWALEAYYLAHAVANMIATLSPEGIILGGSVMHQRQLFPMIRERVAALGGGYFSHPALERLDAYIVAPGLGDRAGICGALALAHDAWREAVGETAL